MSAASADPPAPPAPPPASSGLLLFGWGRGAKLPSLSAKQREDMRHRAVHTPTPLGEHPQLLRIAAGPSGTLGVDEFGRLMVLSLHDKSARMTRPASQTAITEGDLGDAFVTDAVVGDGVFACVTRDGAMFEWGLLHETTEANRDEARRRMGVGRPISDRLRALLEASELEYLTQDPNQDPQPDAHRDEGGRNASANNDGDNNAAEADQRRIDVGILDMATTRRFVPHPVRTRLPSATFRVRHVALGFGHVVVLSEDGTLFAKGFNNRGQCGTGSRVNTAQLARVVAPADERFTAVAAGNSHNLALSRSGLVYAWGSNGLGSLGLGPGVPDQVAPQVLRALEGERVVGVACGLFHSLVLTESGAALSFGHSEYGQHGGEQAAGHDLRYSGLTRYFFTPRVVQPFDFPHASSDAVKLKRIYCGAHFSLGVDDEDVLWAWGFNATGCLGVGPFSVGARPQRIAALVGTAIPHLAVGDDFVVAGAAPFGDRHGLVFAQLAAGSGAADRELADCRIVAKSTWRDRDKVVEAHTHMVFVRARCPVLANRAVQRKDGVWDIELDAALEQNVLNALVEYLLTDSPRSCPPHRLGELRHVAVQLDLAHLAELCSFLTRQRRVGVGSGHLNTSEPINVPPSSFVRDMESRVGSAQDSNVVFSLPAGPVVHTDATRGLPESLDVTRTPLFSVVSPRTLVPAHLAVLKRFRFFELMFDGDWTERELAQQGQAIRLDIPAPVFHTLLALVYTGNVNELVTDENVLQVAEAARSVELDDVVLACERYLLDRTDRDNAPELLDWSSSLGMSRLARACEGVLNGMSG